MHIPSSLLLAISQAQHLVVLTGAGASAESGVPTFRDALTGLWENFDPEELATPEAFVRDPALVWGWYEWRRKMLLAVRPNPAHIAIAELAKRVPRFTLITQNVDDLHERAGSVDVLHLHGSIFQPRCFDCKRPYTFSAPPSLIKEQKLEPPHCEHCGGLIRPGVVWFGESLPEQELKEAYEAVDSCDVLLSVGTSGIVYPAAHLPEMAAQKGASVIHINPQPVISKYANEHVLVGTAGQVLPKLLPERTWSLKEIDESLGVVKGSAFIAFKRVRNTLKEDQDFFYYSGMEQPEKVEELKQSKRVYASTVNAVLFTETAYGAIVSFLKNN